MPPLLPVLSFNMSNIFSPLLKLRFLYAISDFHLGPPKAHFCFQQILLSAVTLGLWHPNVLTNLMQNGVFMTILSTNGVFMTIRGNGVFMTIPSTNGVFMTIFLTVGVPTVWTKVG
jgi:hypothetical protein